MRWNVLLPSAVLAVAAACGVARSHEGAPQPPAPAAVPLAAAQPVAAVQASATAVAAPDFASIAERVLPSVVSIKVEQQFKASRGGAPGLPPEFFQFFGQGPGRQP